MAAPASVEHVVTFGLVSAVKQLIMFHHDPLHTDGQLETMLVRAHELWGTENDGLALAYEGMELDIG